MGVYKELLHQHAASLKEEYNPADHPHLETLTREEVKKILIAALETALKFASWTCLETTEELRAMLEAFWHRRLTMIKTRGGSYHMHTIRHVRI